MKLKDAYSLKVMTNPDNPDIKKQRHYFANKSPSSQNYGFSSGHVWMWELDYKESWAPKKDPMLLWRPHVPQLGPDAAK